MYLKHLSISGFRGIGSDLDLPLDHRTIIFGPNGSGKSSILQAIAWALYGKLPNFVGSTFTREDALVNDFIDEARAEVTLTLSDRHTISRTRDKQKSTSRGTNPLTISGKAPDPQTAVEQLIGLNLDEFFAGVFLYQETIRDFLTNTTDERSAVIDRMIGTFLLRTLVKAVDPKIPAKAIEETQEAIERLDQQLSQASVISKEMIEKRKEEYGDTSELPAVLEEIRQMLSPIAEKLELPLPKASLGDLQTSLTAARGAQLVAVSALEKKVGTLSTLKERYNLISREVIDDVTISPELERRRDQLQSRIKVLSREIPSLNSQIEMWKATRQELGQLSPQIQVLPELREDIRKSQGKLEILSTMRKQSELYNQILSVGREYLEKSQPDHCPLCKQEIKSLKLLIEELQNETPQDVEKMRQDYEILNRTVSQKQSQVTELERKHTRIQALEKTLAGLPADLETQIEARQSESNELTSKVTEVQAEITQMQARLKLSTEHQSRLDATGKEIEKVLNRPLPKDVLKSLEEASQFAQMQAAEIRSLDFAPIDIELKKAMQLAEIQKDEARLRQLESSYQTANREKARLNTRIRRLTDLRDALHDISETAKSHQQTIVSGLLSSLDIDDYYQQLDPHPSYRQLQIEPELTTKGTYNYWIKALTDDRSHATYVQTRFSTAQANCAAIAIFLAVNENLSKKLQTVILDDPSQSMDPDHKKRLAQTLDSSRRQVIVATEDPQMFKILVDTFDTPKVHKLRSWTEEGSALL